MLQARLAAACNDARRVVEVSEKESVVECWYRRCCHLELQRQWHSALWKQVKAGLWQELSLAEGRKVRATIQAASLVGWTRV